MNDTYRVSFINVPSEETLKLAWQDLESRSEYSFFQSWNWIGAWLETLPTNIKPQLLQIFHNKRVVALGLFVDTHLFRHKIVHSHSLTLNATGNPTLDRIYIEYNGLLCDKSENEEHLLTIALDYLLTHTNHDEMLLPGIHRPGYLDKLVLPSKYHFKRREKWNFFVNLVQLRENNKDYISSLGAKTRANVRRAIRNYETLGQLSVNVAETPEQAFYFLKRLEFFHACRQAEKGSTSAFSNKLFNKFHNRLIKATFASGNIQILQLKAGETEIGYLYNLVHNGYVYNYQTGFNYEALPTSKSNPGLVTLVQAVIYNLNHNMKVFDFMAGIRDDYKKHIGIDSSLMTWDVIQRNRVKFHFERALYIIRDLYQSILTKYA